MITYERIGDTDVVTILDDSGKDADIELHWKDRCERLALRQIHDGKGDVVLLTPVQAVFLRELLNEIIREDEGTLQ